jgi:hypothetical protein
MAGREADTNTLEEDVAFIPISSYRNAGNYPQGRLCVYIQDKTVRVCVCVWEF